jgi:hypothetical protein
MVRMPGNDSSAPRAGNDNNLSIEASEVGNRDDDGSEEEDEIEYGYWRRSHAQTPRWFSPVTAPQEAGLKLLMSGEFGRTGVEARSRKGCSSLAKAILSRRSGLRQTPKQDIANVCAMSTLDISLTVMAGYHSEHQRYGRCVTQQQYILWPILGGFVRIPPFYTRSFLHLIQIPRSITRAAGVGYVLSSWCWC